MHVFKQLQCSSFEFKFTKVCQEITYSLIQFRYSYFSRYLERRVRYTFQLKRNVAVVNHFLLHRALMHDRLPRPADAHIYDVIRRSASHLDPVRIHCWWLCGSWLGTLQRTVKWSHAVSGGCMSGRMDEDMWHG